MLKGRGREPRGTSSPAPPHFNMRPPALAQPRTPQPQRQPIKPEPDYEVVEFPSDQYVNAKLQPPPPPPPRPPTGHPAQAGGPCGLCGGGGARVRCAECGRRALCASCDDMYHRHPKRRHHQRQALSSSQLSEVRPPLPPKTTTAPVPPPRRHKMSASPKPPVGLQEQMHATLGHAPQAGMRPQPSPTFAHHQPLPAHIQNKLAAPQPHPSQIGSMPFLNTMPHPGPGHHQMQTNTLGHFNSAWNRPRGSLQGFNMPQMASGTESWDGSEGMGATQQVWGRPLRRGASVLELSGASAGTACAGCAHCGPNPTNWRYGSCASLDHPWAANAGWPTAAAPPACCAAHPHHVHPHAYHHPQQTPQPYRRADSRTMSRAASRTGSRAASPALSVRSRASRRTKHRTPSPPQLPSSDADSESESEERPPAVRRGSRASAMNNAPSRTPDRGVEERSLGPAPAPPAAPWQCEHCTFVNEAGVRVCVVCCRTPTAAPMVIANLTADVNRLNIDNGDSSPHPGLRQSPRVDMRDRDRDATEETKRTETSKSTKERTSTGCGPSPPREQRNAGKATPRLVTPTREHNGADRPQSRHDMAVGPSPPRDARDVFIPARSEPSPLREPNKMVRVSPYRETKELPKIVVPQRHSVSVGPSPPREPQRHSVSVGSSPPRDQTNARDTSSTANFQKKSAGTSPSLDVSAESRPSAPIMKTNVSNTGTSPPPQSISTQTYEDPNTWEREGAGSGAGEGRARSRRRFRDDARRERSRSRHSLSSDTRESERSVRTTGGGGGGGWEWRERDAGSPGGGGGGGPAAAAEWGRLARRASHLDLRRARPQRRSSFYGSQAASPEPVSGRAMSMEALAGARTPRAGLQLARLLADAERLGFDAAEVQVGLEASPEAPLEWLVSRWAGLAGAVCGAAARLAPLAPPLTEREARAALARHRGAVWPAVTECVDALRRQMDAGRVSSAVRVRGRVWGSPAGADDEAAAPRARAEYSSDECDPPPPRSQPYEDEWGFPPAPTAVLDGYELEEPWGSSPPPPAAPLPIPYGAEEVARTLRSLLVRAGVPSVDENLLRGLASVSMSATNGAQTPKTEPERDARLLAGGPPSFDFIQSENDFIDAYNALTRASPLPNISGPPNNGARTVPQSALLNVKTEHNYSRRDDEMRSGTRDQQSVNKTQINEKLPSVTINTIENSLKAAPLINKQTIIEPKKVKIKILQSEEHKTISNINQSAVIKPAAVTPVTISNNQRHELISPTEDLQQRRLSEDKSGNLNDIVDNTQKLIQQMKDEINSDINSLDDGHAQTSQSEHDTSSNDEREESSYSETDEETDNITSDEKEISSEGEHEEEEVKEISKNGATFPNRTSSEDNEQFEEALDNLDTQIEDVKHANIEILDSIARSLQEEHTISIEVNEAKEHEVTEIPIYTKAKEINEPQTEENIEVNHTLINNTHKKQDTNNNLFVAVNSFDELFAELNTSITSSEENNQTETFQIQKTNPIRSSPPVERKILPTKHAIYELAVEIVPPTKLFVSEKRDPIFNAILETIEVVEEPKKEAPVETETTQDETYEKHTINGRSSSESTSSKGSEPSQSENETLDISKSSETKTVVDLNEAIHQENLSADETATNNDQVIEIIQIKQNISVEKESETSANDNNINKTTPVKSNIPKPIKPTQSIKAKVEKLAPKLLVSKVPVRRTSIKQYPAPAPPKTHFGNVQSGHVKQLQSKIFNGAKPVKPQMAVTIDVKPSTSTATLTKKKPAPPPPVNLSEQKQPSPAKMSPPKEKRNNYFRETCRTEDEWTDSDSEDSQSQIAKPSENREEEPVSPPSPPPPITLRRVSGQIIDLASVQLPEGSPERQARMLLAGGAMETWEQARLAVELVGRGVTPAAALLAALECADLDAALAYLHQDCDLCASRLPEHEMVSMLRCTHRCCRECARLYFTVQITERSIADCVCPYCKLPELEALPEDAWLEYFAHLDILLKTLLETDIHELFQRKLRDRTLARDPNFRWCVECSSGFFVHPKQKKLRCPECRSVSCASCRKPWSQNHEGLSCEQYTAWLEDNDPERSVAAVQQHLRENGLECPRCRFKYSLSRGGCMHFTCTQCKYEFCYGCGKPFTMGARCGLSEYCAKLGLHAHHPRNCLFYLRDKEPHELQTLLQMNNVSYETNPSESSTGRCPIQLQRETPAGLVDGHCGSEAPPNYAGLCKNHYLEYLCRVVRGRGVDPLPVLGVEDLETLVRRAALRPPPRPYGSLDGLYKRALLEIVREKIPLD